MRVLDDNMSEPTLVQLMTTTSWVPSTKVKNDRYTTLHPYPKNRYASVSLAHLERDPYVPTSLKQFERVGKLVRLAGDWT